MTRQQIAQLFTPLDRSKTPAAQVDYQNAMLTKSQDGISAFYETVVLCSCLTWQGDKAATILQKLKTYGTNAKVILAFHSEAAQLLNKLAMHLNKSLAENDKIQLLPTSAPGVIEWNDDGSVKSYTAPLQAPVP